MKEILNEIEKEMMQLMELVFLEILTMVERGTMNWIELDLRIDDA